MTTNHTPTPWRYELLGLDDDPSSFQVIRSGPDAWIASTWAGPHEANAEHIVRCVNAHDELVAVLREAFEVMSTDFDFDHPRRVAAVDAVNAALKKVDPQPVTAEWAEAFARAALAKATP